MPIMQSHPKASPVRMLEVLADRFGAFEAIAFSTIKLARHVSECDLSMDLLVAEAILEFGEDLRAASSATEGWACTRRHITEDRDYD
jgi:hypothetical protein